MNTSSIFGLGLVAIILNIVIYGAFIFGGIYFVFWCLKHFGVIGG
jgi:hypothetical protein